MVARHNWLEADCVSVPELGLNCCSVKGRRGLVEADASIWV